MQCSPLRAPGPPGLAAWAAPAAAPPHPPVGRAHCPLRAVPQSCVLRAVSTGPCVRSQPPPRGPPTPPHPTQPTPHNTQVVFKGLSELEALEDDASVELLHLNCSNRVLSHLPYMIWCVVCGVGSVVLAGGVGACTGKAAQLAAGRGCT